MYPYGSMALLALVTFGMVSVCGSVSCTLPVCRFVVSFISLTNVPIILAALLCSLYTLALITTNCSAFIAI